MPQHPWASSRTLRRGTIFGMCRASHLAGKAINISKTTLPHAISYALTSSYGVPHGAAVATTLGAVLVYNSEVTDADCNDPRGTQHVRDRIALILELLGAPNVNAARDRIEQLVTGLGCPRSIAEAGVRSVAEARQIVEQVNAERLSNNPRQASQESLVQMLTVGIDSSPARKH